MKWSDTTLASKDAQNETRTDLMRTDSDMWASTTPCPVGAKKKVNTKHKKSQKETKSRQKGQKSRQLEVQRTQIAEKRAI